MNTSNKQHMQKQNGCYWVRLWEIGPYPMLTSFKGKWEIVYVIGQQFFRHGAEESFWLKDVAEWGDYLPEPK